mgnify:CR=1 FL=1
MKNYYVNDRGVEWVYSSKEKAERKAAELGKKVVEKTEWRYYAPYYSISTSDYRKISGTSLASAIENNFDQIIKDFGLSGVAGYRLTSVKLVKNGDCANLIINLIPLGKLEKELAPIEKVVTIEWVTDDDLDNEYTFDLVK